MITIISDVHRLGLVVHKDRLFTLPKSFYIFKVFDETKLNRKRNNYTNILLFIQDKCATINADYYLNDNGHISLKNIMWWPDKKDYVELYLELLTGSGLSEELVDSREQLVTLLLLELSKLK